MKCEQGAVGLAIWVPSVADHGKENETPGPHSLAKDYSSLSNDTDDEAINEDLLAENLKVCIFLHLFARTIDIFKK